MSTARKVLGVAAGAVGVAAAGTALRVAQRRRVIARRGVGDATPFGSLRSPPLTVVADDGVPLHVEVDELDRPATGTAAATRAARHAELTVVFVHGYALNLDSWHFQRAAYRGLVRTVFYDQRSHGRSGRSTRGQRHHRAARQRPAARHRRGGARRAGRARGPLDGRHDHRGAGRGAPRAVRRPDRRRRPGRHHRRRARPAPDGAAPAAVDGRRPAGHPAGGDAGARAPDRRPVPPGRPLGLAGRDRRARLRRRRTASVRRVRRRDALGDALRRGRGVLPHLRHASTSSRPCMRSRACRPRSSAAPRTR